MQTPNKATPYFSVVICTYKRRAFVEKAVASLQGQDIGADAFETIIVDNGDPGMEAEKARESYGAHPRLSYIIEPAPGLSRARNIGWRESKGAYVAFLDDDAVAHPDWLSQLRHAIQAFEDEPCIIGGRIDPLWEDTPPAWLVGSASDTRNINTRDNPMVGYLSVVNWGGETRELAEGEWVAGANLCFKRSFLAGTEGFSEALGRRGSGATLLSNEENDLMAEAARAGGKIIYAPQAVVDHFVPKERLDRAWFCRRAAWQVVSDMLQKGDDYRISPETIEKSIRSYLAPDGTAPLSEDILFRQEMTAATVLTYSLLKGDIAALRTLLGPA